MIIAIVNAIVGPISSVVSGWLGGSGMWRMWPWNLVPTQVGMLQMVCSDAILSLLFGNGLPSNGQVMKLAPAVCVDSGWDFG